MLISIINITSISIFRTSSYQFQNQYCHFLLSIFPYQCIEQLWFPLLKIGEKQACLNMNTILDSLLQSPVCTLFSAYPLACCHLAVCLCFDAPHNNDSVMHDKTFFKSNRFYGALPNILAMMIFSRAGCIKKVNTHSESRIVPFTF